MKYDAFISYRHGGVDQFVAERLHKKLETFKLPKRLLEKGNGKTRITRVFRDQDELPLSSNLEDSIKDALRESEWLIVICTPRLKESIWCLKEIETFTEMHGQEHILAVLVEGEPNESFPESLRSKKIRKFDAVTGASIEIEEKIEPLAADVRGSSNAKIKAAMDTEILRLLAPMFGVEYDDLKQRQRARKIRRISILASIVIAISVGFGLYSSAMYLRISNQNAKILKQAEEIDAQNAEILEKKEALEEKIEENEKQMKQLLYNQAKSTSYEALQYVDNNMKGDAIKITYEMLTGGGDIPLPVTSYGQYALTEALDIYHYDVIYRSVDSITLDSQITRFDTNGTTDYFLAECASGMIYVYDYTSRQFIFQEQFSKPDISSVDFNSTIGFYDMDKFYIGDSTTIEFFQIANGTVNKLGEVSFQSEVRDIKSKFNYADYVVVECYYDTYLVDVNEFSIVLNSNDSTCMDFTTGDSSALVMIEDQKLVVKSLDGSFEDFYPEPDYVVESYEHDISYVNIARDIDNPDIMYLTYCLSYDYSNFESKCMAFNSKDGSILWTFGDDMYNAHFTIAMSAADKYEIGMYTKYEAHILNHVTGEVIDNYIANSTDEYIRGVAVYDTFTNFMLASGRIIYYFDSLGFTEYTSYIDVKSNEIYKAEAINSKLGVAYAATLNESTSLTIFARNYPDRLRSIGESEFESGRLQCEAHTGMKARDCASEFYIPDIDAVSNVAYIEEKDLIIITSPSYLRVFDTKTTEMLYETTYLRDFKFFMGYYAIDEDDNLILFTNVGALIFNSDRELIANALGASNFDAQTNSIVFAIGSNYFEGPVLSLDEILEFAKIKLGI